MSRTDRPPGGIPPQRLVTLMREAVGRCELNLTGLNVLTEAATGAYVVTPVIAAMAGAAIVNAVTKDSSHGSAEEAMRQSRALAVAAGVADKITFVPNHAPSSVVSESDIVTNSGHVRPLDAATIAQMKPAAVIPLMYEAWEFRGKDIDLEACRRHGVPVGGTNERHSAIDVFSYLGPLAVKLLHDAGVAVYKSRVLLLCDNDFLPYIERGLRGLEADLTICDSPDKAPFEEGFDAVLLAMQPRSEPALDVQHARRMVHGSPGAPLAQFWGDVDRAAFLAAEIQVWPQEPPAKGHMGILLSAIGPEPIIRLQTGGLKAGEVLYRTKRRRELVQSEYVQVVE